jgi:hypothetical protein
MNVPLSTFRRTPFSIGILLVGSIAPQFGCALTEVRNKLSGGPEFRHSGATRTDSDRYTVQEGVELHWENGVTTGMNYRRRDTDDGDGNADNGVFFELGVPLWKAEKKPDANTRRIETLEKRVARLESLLNEKANQKQ